MIKDDNKYTYEDKIEEEAKENLIPESSKIEQLKKNTGELGSATNLAFAGAVSKAPIRTNEAEKRENDIMYGDTSKGIEIAQQRRPETWEQDVKSNRAERENQLTQNHLVNYINTKGQELLATPEAKEHLSKITDPKQKRQALLSLISDSFKKDDSYTKLQDEIAYYNLSEEEREAKAKASAQNSVANQLPSLRSDIEQMLSATREVEGQKQVDKVQDILDKEKNPIRRGLALSAHISTQPGTIHPETDALNTALKYVQDSERIMREHNDPNKDSFSGKMKSAWRGFKDKAFSLDNWTLGVTEAMDQMAVNDITRKLENDEQLSDAETKLMDALAVNLATNLYYDEGNRGYTWGSIPAESLPFMLEFALNPVTGTGNAIAKNVAKYGVKKFGSKVAQKGMQYAGRLAGDLTTAALMTATTGSFRTITDVEKRMQGEHSFGFNNETGDIEYAGREGQGDGLITAIAKGIGSQINQYQSEMFGERLGAIGEVVGATKLGAKISKKFSASMVGKVAGRMGNSNIAKNIKGLERRAQWSGVIGEWVEEQQGTFMNALFIGDEKMSDLVNKDQQIDTFMGLLLSGGVMSGLQTTGYATDRLKTGHKLNKLDNIMPEYLSNWEELKGQISEMNVDDRISAIKELSERNDMSLGARQNLVDYISTLSYNDAMKSSFEESVSEDSRIASEKATDMFYTYLSDKRASLLHQYSNQMNELGNLIPNLVGLEASEVDELIASEQIDSQDLENYRKYHNLKSLNDGIVENLKAEVDNAIQPRLKQYQDNINEDGETIIQINLGSEEQPNWRFVNKGNVVLNEDGSIDRMSSSNMLYSKNEDGKTEQIALSRVYEATLSPYADIEEEIKEEAYKQIIDPFAKKIDGETIHNINDQVEYVDTKGNPKKGQIVEIGEHTITMIDSEGKTEIVTKNQLNNSELTPTTEDGLRARDEITVYIDGIEHNAYIDDIKTDGTTTIGVLDSNNPEHMFMTLSKEELNNMRQPQMPTDAISQAEQLKEKGINNNETVTTAPEQIKQTESKIEEIVSNSDIEESEEEKAEREYQEFEQSLPRYQSGQQEGEINESKLTPSQQTRYFERNFGKEDTIKAVQAQVKKLKTDRKKQEEKVSNNPMSIKERQKLKNIDTSIAEYEDYLKGNIKIDIEAQNANKENAKTLEESKAVQEEARELDKERGQNQVSDDVVQKWNAAPKIEGTKDIITLANGENIEGTYFIVPASAPTPSHDPQNNYAKSIGFPLTADGSTVNDRDYEKDKDAQIQNQQRANSFDMRAVQTPVVVSRDGVVLSGNDRTMAGQQAAMRGTDKAYNDYIRQQAGKWGFTQEQIETIPNARIVFVPDADMPYTTETFAKFNAEEKKSQNTIEKAVKISKTIDVNDILPIANIIDKFDRLSDMYQNAKATKEILDILQDKGIVMPNEVAKLVDTNGQLSEEGKSYLETLLLGSVLNEDSLRIIDTMRSIKQTLVRSMPQIMRNLSLKDYNLSTELNNSIHLLYEAKQAGNTVKLHLSQTKLFEDSAADMYDNIEKSLAMMLDGEKDIAIRNMLDEYNKRAADIEAGLVDMFDGTLAKPDLLNKIIEVYGKEETDTTDDTTGESNQGREERKDVSVEQTGATPQLDEESKREKPAERGLAQRYIALISAIQKLSDQFNTHVKIHSSLDTITKKTVLREIEKGERVKGWYDIKTGEAHIYLPNAESIEDVQATFLHEVLAHKALRDVLGDAKHDQLLTDVFDALPKETQEKLLQDYNGDKKEATDEYIAEVAEKGEFMNMPKKNLIQIIVDAIKNLFSDFKIETSAAEILANQALNDAMIKLQEKREAYAIKEQAIEDGTFMKAPNGKPTNLNERQWLQVRTQNFIKWFGDWIIDPQNASKVVDENGEPMVVYHGSRSKSDFTVFDSNMGNPTTPGNYFSNYKDFAQKFAGPKGKVFEVFLNIRNPIKGTFTGSGAEMHPSEHKDGGIFTKTNTDRYAKEGTKEYIVHDSNQIKSATDNTGSFDASNDDIRFRTMDESAMRKESEHLTREEFIERYAGSSADFRDGHTAPGPMYEGTIEERVYEGDSFNLAEVSQGYHTQPDDYFGRMGARWYGYDDMEGMQSYRAIRGVMQKVDAQIKKDGKIKKMPNIKTYRAVPIDVDIDRLVQGDWVTFSKEYAIGHGEMRFGEGEYKLITENVPADQLWWDGNDINEWGFDDGANLTPEQAGQIWDEARNIRFRISGEKGAANMDKAEGVTTRIDNLSVAKEMAAAKKDAKAIRLATGWEKGIDGKWKYEAGDIKLRPDFNMTEKGMYIATQKERIKELTNLLKPIKDKADIIKEKFQSNYYKDKSYKDSEEGKAKMSEFNTLANEYTVYSKEISDIQDIILDYNNPELKSKNGTYITSEELAKGNTLRLIDIIEESSEVFKEYPSLKKIKVQTISSAKEQNIQSTIDVANGMYNELGIEMPSGEVLIENYLLINDKYLTDKAKMKELESVLNHEIQHAIQSIENFNNGGNLATVNVSDYKTKLIDNIKEDIDKLESRLPKTTEKWIDEIHNPISNQIEELRNKALDIKNNDLTYDAYRAISGEVEARNVQARMGMTEQQRRETLLSETEDVAREDQIIRYRETSEVEDGDLLYRIAEDGAFPDRLDQAGFYSTVESALEGIKQNKGTPQQFKAMLLKNGAKQAELDWMDYDGTFTGKSVTKTEIQDWIDQNKIEIEEVEKGRKQLFTQEHIDEIYNGLREEFSKIGIIDLIDDDPNNPLDIWANNPTEENYNNLIEFADFNNIDFEWVEEQSLPEDTTKYSQYTLPGGENYQELLLTMPVKYKKLSLEEYAKKMNLSIKEAEKSFKVREETTGGYMDYAPGQDSPFTSDHFDEPNILAHIRFNEREVNGERVLFIEEIQSDWAQEGKKKGFKEGYEKEKLRKNDGAYATEQNKKLFHYIDYVEDGVVEQTFQIPKSRYKTYEDAVNYIVKEKSKGHSDIPNMPFKKTDQWVNLALRRMMMYATENGYDRIAWTTGEQQNARYDLSKQVDKLLYKKNEDGTYVVSAIQGGYGNLLGETINESKLEEIVGKEIAKKIVDGEGIDTDVQGKHPVMKSLSGIDLEVGGEGMIAFYNQIVPKAAKKLSKPFGANVETINIPEIGQQQSIPITEELREMAPEGMPLFRKGDREAREAYAIREQAIEDGTFMKAPNGKPTNLNERQWLQVRTQNFIKWFGDWINDPQNASKVVDENGEPEVVYHGSPMAGFTIFDNTKISNTVAGGRGTTGSFFTTDLNASLRYADLENIANRAEDGKERVKTKPTTFIDKVMSLFGKYRSEVIPSSERIPAQANVRHDERINAAKNALGLVDYMDLKHKGVYASFLNIRNPLIADFKGESWANSPIEADGIFTVNETVNDNGEFSNNEYHFNSEQEYREFFNKNIPSNTEIRGKGITKNYMSGWFEEYSYSPGDGVYKFYTVERIKLPNTTNGLATRASINGHDGTIFENVVDANTQNDNYAIKDIVAFEANQIKSATDNVGSFDSENDDIRFRKADELFSNPTKINESVGDYNKFLSDVFNNSSQKSEILKDARQSGMQLDKSIENYIANEATYEEVESIAKDLGIDIPVNAVRYMFWQKANPNDGTAVWKAKDAVKYHELKDNILFRKGGPVRKSSLREYESTIRSKRNNGLKGFMYGMEEGWFDRMISLKILQDSILQGKDMKEGMNAYLLENQLSSKNTAEIESYQKKYLDPMIKIASKIFGKDLKAIDRYLMAKHGFERNAHMAKEQAKANGQKKRDEYKKQLDADKITEDEYNELMDKQDVIDAKNAANLEKTKDYSGLTQLYQELTGEDATYGEEEREFLNKYVSDIETKAGKEDIKELWNSIKQATQYMVRKQFDSGMMSKENFDIIMSMYEYYVPLRGFEDTVATDIYEYLLNKPSDFNKVLMKAKGRTSMADSPFASILNMAESGIMQANRNNMKKAFYRLVATNPSNYASIKDAWYIEAADGKWIETHPDIPLDATGEEVKQIVDEFEAEMQTLEATGGARRGRNKLDVGVRIGKSQASEHAVNVWVNGEEKVVYVNGNPRAAQAINGLTNSSAKERGYLLRTAQFWMRQMSANFTSRNPAFMVTNAMRDWQFAILSSGIKHGGRYSMQLVKNTTIVGKTVAQNIWGDGNKDNSKFQQLWEEFSEYGGETGYAIVHSMDANRKYVNSKLREFSNATDYLLPFRSYVHHMENANRQVEANTRFAAYVTSREMGKSIEQSIADSKDVSINFNRKGSGGFGAGIVHNLYLFANPALQSMRQMGLMAKNHPIKFTLAMSTTLASGYMIPLMNEIMLEMVGDDDDKDKYFNLSDWTRRNHIVMYAPWTKNRFITLSLPHELRGFYGLGEMAYSAANGKMRGKNIPIEALKQFANNLPIDPTGGKSTLAPDVIKPFYEAYVTNENFMGTPIYKDSPWNKHAPEWTKAYKRTSPMFVKATKALNELTGGDDVIKGKIDINPAKIQHVLGGYVGGAWTTYTDIVDMAANLITGEEISLNDVPIANKIIRTSDERNKELRINNEYFYWLDWKDKFDNKYKGYQKWLYKKENHESGNVDKYKDKLINTARDQTDMTIYEMINTYSKIIKETIDAGATKEEMKLKNELIDKLWELDKSR